MTASIGVEPAGAAPGRRAVPRPRRRGGAPVAGLSAAAAGLVALAGLLALAGPASPGGAAASWAVLVLLAGLAGLAIIAGWALYRGHAAVAARADRLTQAFDASPHAQLITGPADELVYANAAFHALFPDLPAAPLAAVAGRLAAWGGSRESFGRLCAEVALAVATGAASAATTWGQAAALGEPTGTARVALLAADSTTLWLDLSVHRLEGHPGGHPGGTLWRFENVTQRHEMEQVIHDERLKLADFLDNAPIGFYSVDGAGRFLFVNAALAEWLGAGAAELVEGKVALHEFLLRPAPPGAPRHAPFAGGDEGASQGEVVLRGRQGRIVYASISQSVVQGPDGLRTRSVVRDLTPERQWEKALRLSRERFRHFFANAPVGIALLDRAGRLEEANRALGELFGRAPAALIGAPLVGFLSGEDRSAVAAKLAAAAEGEPLAGPVEVRLAGPREKSAALFVSRLDHADEARSGLILHFIDTSDQKSLEAQIAQSHKMQAVGQLAGGVAHDFNNLLTAMIGFCDLLLLRFRPGDPSFADIMQIKQNANRAANLVRQLLAFSRQQTLQPRVLSITDVLAELSHLLRRLIGENIELKVVHGRDLGLVKVDQGQLEQVIINLAVNARDAMPGGGVLSIRTANLAASEPWRRGHEVVPPGDYVTIEVADTGVGIPRENLERVFEPFFSTKEVGSGTGLGLSTVYGIVKQTGGFVIVESALGEGARFSILLPRHGPGEAGLPVRAEPGEPAPGRDLTGVGTVLLVEDEDPVRLFSARALRNKGYRVIEAKSGEAALELITNAAEPVDLIITDVVMPRIDGPGLIRRIRELHPDMKVIFISGYTEDNFRQRLDTDAEIHFLPKPFSLKQLASKVKEVMPVA